MTTATAIDPPTATGSLQEEQTRLRQQLARSRRMLRVQMVLEFALEVASCLVLTALVLVALDYWLRLGLTPRQILGWFCLLNIVLALGLAAWPRLRAARLDDLGLAMTLDRVRPGTGQQVADVLQLPEQLEDDRWSASPALIRRAVREASDSLAAVNWRAHWNAPRTAIRLLTLLAVVAIPVSFALAAPAAARLSVARWLLGSNERWPQRTYLAVTGLGDRDRLIAPRDEPYSIEVRADLAGLVPLGTGFCIPGRGQPLTVRQRPATPVVPDAVRLIERSPEGAVRDSVMNIVGPSQFRLELPPSSTSTIFDLKGGDDWLGPIQIKRVDRPALAETKLRVRDPGASEGAMRPIEDIRQHLIFLPDTELELTLVGTEAIKEIRVDVHPGKPPTVTRVDPKSFITRFPLREATTLEMQLTAESSGLVSKPTFLSVGLLKDRDPRIILRAQGVGAHVTPIATIPVTMAATDDLGLGAIRLQIERTVIDTDKPEPVSTKQTVAIPLATDGGRPVLDHQARHDVNLQVAPPPIGATIRLTAEAEDRCARGPQVGRSSVLHFQVISADELFYEILIRQRAERAKFVAAYEAADKLKTTLAGTPAVEAYTAASRALHTGTRQLELIAGRISDSLAEMKLNQVGSPKSHRLLQDGVIDPILALNTGQGSELRTILQALANGSKAQGDAEKARQLHSAFMAQMKVILDQMSQWESFVDVVNQVAEVIKMQQNVLKATEKARDSWTQEVFDDKP